VPLVVKELTQPAVEPVLLADAKLHLRVTFDDDDALITSLITAARRLCEVRAGVVFVSRSFLMVDDGFPFVCGALNRQVRQFYGQFQGGQGSVMPGVLALNAGIIILPRAPLVSIDSVQYLDTTNILQTLNLSQYVVTTGSPGRMAPIFGAIWPVTLPQIGAVQIQFTAGYSADASAVPANVVAAIKLVLGLLYENREAVIQGSFAELPASLAVDGLLGIEDNTGGYS
jgi:hypothetical protein